MSYSRISNTIGVLSKLCDLEVEPRLIRIGRPDVKFFCDLDYDPFLIMQDQKKAYGNVFHFAFRNELLIQFRVHCVALRVRGDYPDSLAGNERCTFYSTALALMLTKPCYRIHQCEPDSRSPGQRNGLHL
jgi:hypothetical protein